MQPQHVAGQRSSDRLFEAFASQPPRIACGECENQPDSSMLGLDCIEAIEPSQDGQVGACAPALPVNRDRRLICRTVSKAFWRLALLPWLQHVVASKKKNMWWLSPSPFRSNPSTPVNTSKPCDTVAGRAAGPALIPLLHPSFPGGAPC